MGWVRVVNRLEISTQPNPINKWVRRVDPFIVNGLKISTQPATIGLGSGWIDGLGGFLRALREALASKHYLYVERIIRVFKKLSNFHFYYLQNGLNRNIIKKLKEFECVIDTYSMLSIYYIIFIIKNENKDENN